MPDFICPICQSPLTVHHKTWQCDGSLSSKNTRHNAKATQHPFDVARQGYINLLPVQQKKSKSPGDSPESVHARQRFLADGFYQQLQQAIGQQIAQYIHTNPQLANRHQQDKSPQYNWLDIGCGEGYYSLEIGRVLTKCQPYYQLLAVDISKVAVLELAKKARLTKQLWLQQPPESQACAIYPVVASVANLPIVDNSLDGISSIFSPILPDVFAQKLKTDGLLIIAKPDVGHLASIRQALFDSVQEHDSDKFLDQLADDFKLITSQQIDTRFDLNHQQLSDLLTMTPYAYRATPQKRQDLLQASEQHLISTEAKFVVYILQRK